MCMSVQKVPEKYRTSSSVPTDYLKLAKDFSKAYTRIFYFLKFTAAASVTGKILKNLSKLI